MKSFRTSAFCGFALVAALFLPIEGSCQDLVISEFMASNDGTLTNGQGETHDWIEIFNVSTSTVDLGGWHLTDNDGDLEKWTFPATGLAPGAYLLVYASGSNTAVLAGELHANFQLRSSGEYLALVRPGGAIIEHAYSPEYPEQSTDVSFGLRPSSVEKVLVSESNTYRYMVPIDASDVTNWVLNGGFDDSSWTLAAGAIGYEHNGSDFDGVIVEDVGFSTTTMAIYQRSHFVLDPGESPELLTLFSKYNDGFVVYLNGQKALSINAPASTAFDTAVFTDRDNTDSLFFEDFDLNAFAHLLQPGTNTLAVHTLNFHANPFGSEMLMSFELHAVDISPDLSGETRFFHTPTPGAANLLGEADFLKPVIFDPLRGYYTNEQTVTLSMNLDDFDIWYTLDGTDPTTSNGVLYTLPLQVASTTVVRARGYREGFEPSPTMTHTYLFIEDIVHQPGMNQAIINDPVNGPKVREAFRGLASLSIASGYDNFFDPDIGIYAVPFGRGVAWERPCSLEWIETDGSTGFQLNAGIRLYGNASRGRDKKPFRLLFKRIYGAGKLDYRLFSEKGAADSFDTVILRSGNGDQIRADGVREPYVRRSQISMSGHGTRSTYAHVYLDGVYWGVYNVTERPDQNFGWTYFGGDRDQWDALNSGHPTGESQTATWGATYSAVYAGVSNNVLYQNVLGNFPNGTRDSNRVVHLNVDNQIDYMMLNIWAGMGDWPGANWYANGVRTNSAGWRFFCWDSESSLGLTTDISGTGGPGGLHGKLKDSAEYRLRFADRVRIHYFNDGALTPAVAASRYEQLYNELRPGVFGNHARWGGSPTGWENVHISRLNNYMPARTAISLQQFRDRGLYPLIDAPEFNQYGGTFSNGFRLRITASNTVYYMMDGTDPRELDTGNVQGILYNSSIPLQHNAHVKARARSGAGEWSALTEAFFTDVAFAALQCTEIMPQPMPPADTNLYRAGDFEFVELKNTGLVTLDLEHVEFTDGIDFTFPSVPLAPGAYVLVVSDTNAFATRYNTSGMIIAGEFEGSLNDQGERIRLKSWDDGIELSTFEYDNSRGWPLSAQGGGHALVPNPALDQTINELDHGSSWRAGAFRGGSPGAADPDPIRDIVINEIVAHTDYSNAAMPEFDSNDAIELFNAGDGPVTLTNWYLSDDVTEPDKWPIPPTLSLTVSHWLAFDEVTGFHNPTNTGFGLNKAGDEVVVSYLPGTDQDRIADAVRFKAQRQGFSWNRYLDGEEAWFELLPTTNAPNGLPIQHVVINEIMYHPPDALEDAAGVDLQYIELFNPLGGPVTLASDGVGWRIDGGVDYNFATNVSIPSLGHLLLVDFYPGDSALMSAFMGAYGLTSTPALVFGPLAGNLSDEGERVALERPEAPDIPGGLTSWVIVDEVIYFDTVNWPAAADGGGTPLQRVALSADGNLPSSWTGSLSPSPGGTRIKLALTTPFQGEVFYVPANIPLSVIVDDNQVAGSVDRVDFILDGSVIATDATSPYSVSLVGLTNDGTYILSAEIVDDGGTNASTDVSVDILALSTLPPDMLTDVSAEFRGRLDGNVAANVSFYYGTTDGGTDKSAWDNSGSLGSTAPGDFSATVGNLDAGVTHYVRAHAQDAVHEGWAPEGVSFVTPYFNQWSNRMEITFPGYGDPELLTQFPALVVLSTNIPGYSYAGFRPDATDLRFTLADGIPLEYELEHWNTNGESTLWVLLPALSTNGPVIYAHWGNPQATDAPSTAIGAPVWGNAYRAVWHFGESLIDSTGTEIGLAQVAIYGDGLVGRALQLSGSNQVVDLDIYAGWYADNTDSMTISVWVKPDNNRNGNVYGADDPADLADLFMSSGLAQWRYNVAGNQALVHPMAVGDWQMLTLVMDGTQARGYWNDDPADIIGSYTPFVPSADPLLGAVNGSLGDEYEGLLDEFRLSDVVRSETWIYSCYRTVAENSSFTAYQVVDAAIPDIDIDGLPDAWERDVLGGEGVSAGSDDTDLDGLDDLGEFTAGTSPTNAMEVFHLYAGTSGGLPDLRFDRIPTTEPYYTNQVRLYALECIDGLISNAWQDLPDATNIPAVAVPFVYTNFTLSTNAARFYRGRVWLQPAVTN